MAKPALKKPPVAAVKAGPKLAAGKSTAAKPNKLAAAKTKATEPKVNFKEGDIVEFVAYQNKPEGDEALLTAGERLVVTAKKKDADTNQAYFEVVKEEDYETFKETPDDVTGDQVYPSEIKKAEKREIDTFAIELIKDSKLDELLSDHDGDALETAKQLQEDAARNLFYLGGAYQVLYANRTYLEYGDNGEGQPNDYADDVDAAGNVIKMSGWNKFTQENFSEHGRAAFDKIGIYRSFTGLLTEDKLQEIASDKKIGYVKLALVKNIVNKDNIDEIVDLAREQNVSEFRETIKTSYVAEGGEARSGGAASGVRIKRTVVKVAFYEDQSAAVNYIVDQCKKDFGTDELNVIFERIITEWAMQNLGEPIIKKARAEKRKVIKALKANGADVTSRTEADAELEEYLASRNETAEAA